MVFPGPELLSGVIDTLYESVSGPSKWQVAIDRLRVLFNGSTACLVRSGPDLQPSDAVSSNPDPEFQLRYIEDHAPYPNVYADALGVAPVGLIYSDRALIGDDVLRRSRFWNDWLAPQDMYGGLGSKLMTSGPSFWIFDVQRGRNQQAFDANEVALLQLIMPHLRRATELGWRFQAAQLLASSYVNLPFGVLVVDGQLRVIQSNDVADTILLRQASMLRIKSGMLTSRDHKTMAALHRLVADACAFGSDAAPGTGGELLLRAAGDDPGIDVAVTVSPAARTQQHFPQSRQAIIYLRVLTLALPDGFEDHARQLFDLTPAEARLAAALASGLALKDAAIQQGIRFTTARSYLENIFRKTGTRQQSQLVALLKSTQPLIGKA